MSRLADNEQLGWCGLKCNLENEEYDLGFRFFRSHWNQGYATETSRDVLEYGSVVLNVKEIIARAMIDHVSSRRVFDRLGMQRQRVIPIDGYSAYLYQIRFP